MPARPLLILAILLTPFFAQAVTYYVDGSVADDGGNGSSWVTAKKTISSGIALMSGGDSLVIANGTYAGNSNRILNVPNGTPGSYTTIRAAQDWGVKITNASDYPCHLSSKSYVLIQGIKFFNNTPPQVWLENSDHIKIIRCCSNTASGNAASFLASNSTHALFEECYAWGCGRYPFQVNAGGGSSQYIVHRRCVVRWDYSNVGGPQACFANYDQSNVYFQNCIAIDGIDNRGFPEPYDYDGIKGFFTPNGANDTRYDGCMVLNMEGAGYWLEDPVQNITLMDSFAWACKNHSNSGTDGYPPRTVYIRPAAGPVSLTHGTFGGSDWTSRVMDSDLGAGDSIQNSIIANFTALSDGEYAESGFDVSDYNVYYGNTAGRHRSGGLGAHSVTLNPFSNSLRYLPRIEAGSDLSERASDGGAIGAVILKKIGVSGTLYGETGWDTVTSDNLWPFPNEGEMKADMGAFYMAPEAAYAGSPEMSGARGFCAGGDGLYGGPITLTSYIWEYLGNSCPAEICSASGNLPPPPPPEGGSLNNVRSYPNPWRSDRHAAIGVTFDRMTSNSTVKIFTVSGRHVHSLEAPSGSVVWDLKNDSGDKVASGIYLYVITNDQGQKTRGKVVIIK
jgi:hypothetical protein